MNKLIEERLIDSIGEERYLHCLRVAEIATILGEKHNLDVNDVKMAALLHDCAKFEDKTKLLKMGSKFDIIIDSVMEHSIELIHGPLGAKIAEDEYGIKDLDILNAIRYHTTGREDMTILDKIIYISDYIEPSRKFIGIEETRAMAYEDLDMSILLALEDTIKFLMDKNRLIHLDTIKARNSLRIIIENAEIKGGK